MEQRYHSSLTIRHKGWFIHTAYDRLAGREIVSIQCPKTYQISHCSTLIGAKREITKRVQQCS